MNGKICFGIEDKNVEIDIVNSKIEGHDIEVLSDDNTQYTGVFCLKEDNSDMTDEEYNQFYEENNGLMSFLRDLESL